MSNPFHIYRSSAGSGKTYTLAREYLKLALTSPQAFRNILGVTFTNKATEEMKSRIVSVLEGLANDDSQPMTEELMSSLNLDRQTLQTRARSALTDILHQYGRFSVVTIDSFFHQVIRSFAKEMGLQGTFTIDLDLDKVMQSVIDQLLLEVGEEDKKQLRAWLTQFAEHKVEEGKSWDFRRDISGLAKEIFKDDFKTFSDELVRLSEEPQAFDLFRKEINQIRFSFEQKVSKICDQAKEIIQNLNIDPTLYKGGSRSSPALIFYNITDKKYAFTKTQRTQYQNQASWIKAKDPNQSLLESGISQGLGRLFDELVDFVDANLLAYKSSVEAGRYFYTFGILTELNNYLQKYRDEHDVMLIADLPDFLSQIISDSDTPYIYEKVGSIFNHYLIDEFQDTSLFQWNNFKPLVKNAVDQGLFSMVVGDVKQSIYRFRGGDWDLLQSRVKFDIGQGFDNQVIKEESLKFNWRSSSTLVSFNNTFFSSVKGRSFDFFSELIQDIQNDQIRKEVEELMKATFQIYDDVEQEAANSDLVGSIQLDFVQKEKLDEDMGIWDETIRRTIEQVERLQRNGFELRDIAILCRWNKEGKRIADAIIDYANSDQSDPELKYHVVSSEALYLTSSHVVRFLVSIIKWLNDESNTIVLTEWLYEYLRYVQQSDHPGNSAFSDHLNWAKFVPNEFVRQKDYLKSLPLYELVEGLVNIFRLSDYTEEITYLQGFQDAILDYSKNERGDIPSFLDWWEEVRKERAIQIADENNAIKILTIHKAKGLEFPAVLIPLMSWSMDNQLGPDKDTILWCQGASIPPYDRLPVVPLKYSAELTNTYWARKYYEEKLKAYIDNLNILYVAFTRPIGYLWTCAEKPKYLNKISSVNQLVLKEVMERDEWDEDKDQFILGKIPEWQSKKKQALEYGLHQYHSHSWRGKVSLQMKGSAELSGAAFVEHTLAGIRLHSLLSKVKYKTDLAQIEDIQDREKLEQLLSNEQLSDWFSDKWRVETEAAILLPGGGVKRVDRLNFSADETIIIDFKTGSKRSKDRHQVEGYKEVLTQMGFPGVSGYLVYVEQPEIIKV